MEKWWTATSSGDLHVVKTLLDENPSYLNRKDTSGLSGLHHASSSGKENIVHFLLSVGADPNLRNKLGRTALMSNSCFGHSSFEIMETLLKFGANINLQDKTGRTALMFASTFAGVDVVELLLKNGADVNVVSKDKYSALIHACDHRDFSLVQILLNCNADVNLQGKDGWTALMSACIGGDLDMVNLVLQHGADVNVRDVRNNFSALAHAFFRENYDIALRLLDVGANINDLFNLQEDWKQDWKKCMSNPSLMNWIENHAHRLSSEALSEWKKIRLKTIFT